MDWVKSTVHKTSRGTSANMPSSCPWLLARLSSYSPASRKTESGLSPTREVGVAVEYSNLILLANGLKDLVECRAILHQSDMSVVHAFHQGRFGIGFLPTSFEISHWHRACVAGSLGCG